MRLDNYLSGEHDDMSRSLAKKLIAEGVVTVNGTIVTKQAYQVKDADTVLCTHSDQWVSRGAYKLLGALKEWDISVRGRVCLDIGASTGGFTQVLLESGASRVYAVDVGHDQLHPHLISDDRVVNEEGVNIRSVTREHFPEPVSLIVVDVSFISLHYILPIAANILEEEGVLIALIKPQFEVGKGKTKKGIVCEEELRYQVKDSVVEKALSLGFDDIRTMESPIKGVKGNAEFLIHGIKR